MCYVNAQGEAQTVRGTVDGYIGFEKKGSNGFGYDPIFMRGGKSFAELSADEKNAISHRSNALKKLVEIL
jgi:XTP/dITP diphosphohydrolase